MEVKPDLVVCESSTLMMCHAAYLSGEWLGKSLWI